MNNAITWLVVRAQNGVAQLREREQGQTFVEYALLIGGIGIFLIVAMVFLRGRIGDLFSSTGSSVTSPVGGGS
jgi:Flp pilus assembly pilin Flp